MKKRILLVFSLFFAGTIMLFSQNIKNGNTIDMGFSVSPGYALLGFKNLNNELAKHGYPELTNHCFKLSGQLLYDMPTDKMYGSIQAGTIYQARSNTSSTDVSVAVYDFSGKEHFRIFQKNKLNIHAFGGTGLSAIRLDLIDKSANWSIFDSVMTHVSVQAKPLTSMTLILDFGISVNRMIFLEDDKSFAGLQVGYMVPVYRMSWYNGESKLTDGPKINTGGFYAGLVFSAF